MLPNNVTKTATTETEGSGEHQPAGADLWHSWRTSAGHTAGKGRRGHDINEENEFYLQVLRRKRQVSEGRNMAARNRTATAKPPIQKLNQ